MTFELCKRQPSKKAWMVRVNGFVYFVPRSFPYKTDDKNLTITIELPEWFKLK